MSGRTVSLDISSIAVSVCFLPQYSYMKKFVPAREIFVCITLSSNKGSGEPTQVHRLARVLGARIHKIRMQIKTQTKF